MDCNDSWVLPPLSDTNNGLNQEQNQRPSSSLSSSLCSRVVTLMRIFKRKMRVNQVLFLTLFFNKLFRISTHNN